MEKIEGARLIGSTWHYNKRVPKRLVEAFDLASVFQHYKNGFIRGSMKTKDSNVAKRRARDMLNRLDKLEAKLDAVPTRLKVYDDLSPSEQERLKDDIERNVATLSPDQRQLINRAGGAFAALRRMEEHEVKVAFMAGAEGADYRLMDDMGEEYDPDEREIDEAQDVTFRTVHEKKGRALRDALSAAKVIEPTSHAASGLRALLDKFCNAKGYVHTATIQNKTRKQYE